MAFVEFEKLAMEQDIQLHSKMMIDPAAHKPERIRLSRPRVRATLELPRCIVPEQKIN